ncbi:MAG: transcriptional regulator, partial [Frankiales bacterium]|nr:transcriptional regulator [Frankiales bacterium]
MNKAELIEAIAARIGDKRTATAAVEAVVDAVTSAVAKGEKVAIAGFGVFEKVDRAARIARNPATGAPVKLKATSVPKFRAGQGFKDVVSGAKKLAPTVAKSVGGTVMAAKKAAPKKAAKKAPAKKAAAKKAPAKKAPAKKAPAKKAPAKKAPAKKAPAKKAPAKKAPAKKAPAKKAPAK